MAHSTVFIAVDFGTAFSGYCFKIAGSTQLRQPVWGEEHSLKTCKTPTSILFDENGKFLKFGYDAVIFYSKQIRTNEAKKFYLFDNFKMELYGQVLHRDVMLTAKNGKKMRAMKVFSESLRFMKDHALEMIGKHTARAKPSASDATWILTVPAIWSASAKQFMREAATEAGLVTEYQPDRLIVALEPEAASVWCRQLPRDGFVERDLAASDKIKDFPGTKYMVVDCGGGTIDITVHEVVEGGCLKELHKVSGSDMGGQKVDKNFKTFLIELFSRKVFDEFEKNHPSELQRLMYDFSNCKGYEKDVLVQCPFNLQQIASRYQGIKDYFKKACGAEWESGQILLPGEKMRSLHDDSLRSIESLIKDILKNLKIDYLFLVGGFGLSPYVNSLVREKFGGQCKVVCPADAQMAVLYGAVTFGTNPNVVLSRISRFTYGIEIGNLFDETKHRGKRKYVTKEGKVYCDVCFKSLVKKDESVRFNEVREHDFIPLEKDQKTACFSFYRTERKTAEFTDEPGMTKIGSLTVSMPVIKEGSSRSVILKIKFGFTEMQATATDVDSGESGSVKLDFLSK
uniref:Heat shock 70 kDa protein 12A-like n=1 Tax=Astyanax mexicanus TaxID=7994 RepID=A0A3B1JPU7_ASTMX